MKKCAVIIPIYKHEFSDYETRCVRFSIEKLIGANLYFCAPENLNIDFYINNFPNVNFKHFEPEYFRSVSDYSRLMLSDKFYNSLEGFTHVLIYQPDAVIFKPDLEFWIDQPYDYIGAPWINGFECSMNLSVPTLKSNFPLRGFVGNGGLSLRNISAVRSLFAEYATLRNEWHICGHAEDLFFGLVGNLSRTFRLPNIMVAALFSHEMNAEILYNLTGNTLPFGAHAVEKYSVDHWNLIFNRYNFNQILIK
jgi:hypothetical protein